ncbi:hypothetical protein BDV96DRAFT_610713 [Lophiotrema nucula]|uniref:Uncharacterized protein n=1 Tax=Lophiotrema nucula TaxID=690887 RepID=A0A6A5ZH05_9PLEO|nr:hypothetical protein BDV96DRAFT_610713 [Lophiotrema nucula]
MLATRFLWVHRSGKNNEDSTIEYSVDPNASRFDIFSKDRSWVRMFSPKRDRGQWVPTLSGIIKAGDEGIYSSALINGMHGQPGEVFLDALYDAFAQELKSRPVAERSSYPPVVSRFLSTSRQRVRRSQTVRTSRDSRPSFSSRPQRSSIDVAEKGLLRSRSLRTTPALISAFTVLPSSEKPRANAPTHLLWSHDLQHAQHFEGRISISVSATELASLVVMLGSPVDIRHANGAQEKDSIKPIAGSTAYGLSIYGSSMEDGTFRVTLYQQKRSVSQLPSRGSGYSTLFAKHLASGSIPFSQDDHTVSSLQITQETFDAIRAGKSLHVQSSAVRNHSSRFLASLPASRQVHFHSLTESAASTSTPLLLHSIAALPYIGGLVPLVAKPVIDTVQFVVSGGLPAARLLQRLEALVDKVHRHSPGLQIFGPLFEPNNAGRLFRERERLGKLATGKIISEALADKTARMHRYITLLERLMALVPGRRPNDVLAAIREATKKELERSYEDAIAATRVFNRDSGIDFQLPTFPVAVVNRLVSGRSTRRQSKRSSSASSPTPGTPPNDEQVTSLPSRRSSAMFPPQNLGTQAETLLKAELPFDVPTIATVARLILVAWTLSVQTVAWEDGEEGIRLDGLESLPTKMIMY